ncbi:MAG: hypothetical protein KDB00_28935 [Planctomycetales bacterium]|nr:hypothetical protein [Planctomycetales bacterium]
MSMQICDHESAVDHGTLLWIGDRDASAYYHAYDFCETQVSQLAYRRDLKTALQRPATSVRTILCCRDNDSAESVQLFQELCRRHPDAKPLLLLGPLCAGSRPSPGDLFGVPTINWHDWESFLPGYLRRCGWANQPVERPHSIAVVASNSANASALLSIASSGQASAVSCRPDQISSLRNFDEIWWDDSATKGRSWSDLLGQVREPARENVWISNDVTPRSRRLAIEAGISLVIAKPGDYSLLINRVVGSGTHEQRRAA